MKIIFFCSAIFFSSIAFPVLAPPPIWQVVYHLSEKGKIINSSSVIIQEGTAGEIKNSAPPKEESLWAIVKPLSAAKVSVDYRFKIIKNGETLEIAKANLPFTPGATETNDFKDSGGHDFHLEVKIVAVKR